MTRRRLMLLEPPSGLPIKVSLLKELLEGLPDDAYMDYAECGSHSVEFFVEEEGP